MTSSLAAVLSSAVELIKDRADVMTANGIRWGTWSVLATALLHFPELETELELFGSRRNTDLMEDQVDALWTQTRQASELLVSFIPPSVAHGSPDGMGEE
jgi:hypothetical protein